ncbi:MAG: 4Fe-4S binding protein [Peptostreptococcaceae bacterium]|nr:4Fe-4S binding protein [Peptostreptococcaceae bacterium]
MKKSVIADRRITLAFISIIIIILLAYYKVNPLYLLVAGATTGIIFGKVFCRWMCPIGFVLEFILGGTSRSKRQQMYNYHKIGCPIAWVSGGANRFSLFKIRRDSSTCTNCGKCDDECYISTLNNDCSLYKNDKKDPALEYTCSKCMKCIDACPTNSLDFKVQLRNNSKIRKENEYGKG